MHAVYRVKGTVLRADKHYVCVLKAANDLAIRSLLLCLEMLVVLQDSVSLCLTGSCEKC